MATLREVRCSVGEYAGDGQEEKRMSLPCQLNMLLKDADRGGKHQYLEEDEHGLACMTDDTRPLLVLFDCETTWLSIYTYHITDIGTRVLNPPVHLPFPLLSGLSVPFLPLVTKYNNITLPATRQPATSLPPLVPSARTILFFIYKQTGSFQSHSIPQKVSPSRSGFCALY